MKNKISPVEYNKILPQLDLSNIYLTQISAELNEDNVGKGLEINLKEDSKYKQLNKNLLVDYKIEFSAINNDTKKIAISIITNFRMEYIMSSDINITEEFMDVFIPLSVSIQIWPYFREIIQSTVNKMNLPNLVLPLKKQTN